MFNKAGLLSRFFFLWIKIFIEKNKKSLDKELYNDIMISEGKRKGKMK